MVRTCQQVGNGVTNGITVNTAPRVDASFALPYIIVSHATIVMFAPNSQELRELIQGPGDVEWRYDLAPCVVKPSPRTAVKRRYDMRHQCQEILPGLLLGPFQVSKNLATLKELSITHMYASCLQDFRPLP